MADAIVVNDLSKTYRLGQLSKVDYGSLRETISRTFMRRFGCRRAPAGLGLGDEWDRDEPLEVLRALDSVTFNVRPGEVLGLVGRNGAGKSTLLKVLSRITEPTSGTATIRGRLGSLLEVGTGFHQELTGRENIYLNGAILGMSRREIARKFDEIVAFAEVERFLDTPVKRYSSGMYVRLAFAVAAHLEPEILVVDEVLAVGDMAFQRKCLGKMGEVGKEGRTILFVSHNMSAIKSLCSRAILLDSGRLVLDDDVDAVVNAYLATGTEMSRTGVIPADAPRLTNGDAAMRSVRLTDLSGRSVTQLYFGQPFRVVVDCDVERSIPDGHFEVSISTIDGTHVTYSTSIDGGRAPVYLDRGRHRFEATIRATLLPRDYTIDLGVHHHNGTTCDYVQRTLDFSVLRVAEQGDDHYRWGSVRGLLRATSSWVHTPPSGESLLSVPPVSVTDRKTAPIAHCP